MRRRAVQWDPITADALPDSWVTHLHLLRHGAVDTGGRRLAYGHSDLPLSAEGHAAAADLVGFARDQLPPIDRILSSDLTRCSSLAQALGDALGVPVELDADLREQHMGQWEGQPWGELTAQFPDQVHGFWGDYATTRPPGGESMADLSARVGAWWARCGPGLVDQRALVVTHIGVIRVLLCQALGVPLDQALRFAPQRGTHSHLLWSDAGHVLQVMGEQPPVRSPAPRAVGRRIALSGSAGTGKSTLGRALAAQLDLPYIPEGMRSRLEAGLDLHLLGHDAFRALLWELWEAQVVAEDAAVAHAGGYVADRSPWDFAAFWLHYRFAEDRAETEQFFATVAARAAHCDHILLLPWGALPLVDDGVRNPNPWLQRHFQACLEGLLARQARPGQVLRLPPLQQLAARVDWVMGHFGS